MSRHYGSYDHYWWKSVPHADMKRIRINNRMPGSKGDSVTFQSALGSYPYAVEPPTPLTFEEQVATLEVMKKEEENMLAHSSGVPNDPVTTVVPSLIGGGTQIIGAQSETYPTLAEAATNKTDYGTIFYGTEYVFRISHPQDTAYHTYVANIATTSFPGDYTVTTDYSKPLATWTFTANQELSTIVFDYSLEVTSRLTLETETYYFQACATSGTMMGNRLPASTCWNDQLDKTGENINLTVGLVDCLPLPLDQTNNTEPNQSAVHYDVANGQIQVQRSNTGDANPWSVPVFFNNNHDLIKFQFGTDYIDDNGGQLSGSPQTTTWGICPNNGNGSYNLLVDNTNFDRDIDNPSNPDFEALTGLHYVKVNTAVPTKNSTTPYRNVEFSTFQTTLPTTWSWATVNADTWTISGTPDFGANIWRLGNAPNGTEFDVEVPIPNNVPFDYGRSFVIRVLGVQTAYVATTLEINDQDPTGATGWRTINVARTAREPYAMVKTNREAYDLTTQSMKFKMRSSGNGLIIMNGYYLST